MATAETESVAPDDSMQRSQGEIIAEELLKSLHQRSETQANYVDPNEVLFKQVEKNVADEAAFEVQNPRVVRMGEEGYTRNQAVAQGVAEAMDPAASAAAEQRAVAAKIASERPADGRWTLRGRFRRDKGHEAANKALDLQAQAKQSGTQAEEQLRADLAAGRLPEEKDHEYKLPA